MTEREADPSTGADDQVIPAAASDSWRTWLMTGVRRGPVARRRLRGAHKGIKKILVEGTSNGGDVHPWKDFSGVMVRQAVDEAVNTLPAQQKQAVKLAYFAGLSNREIGEKLGLSGAGVAKRLREALATVSEYVERGRSSARRVVLGLVMLLPYRLLKGPAHMVQAGVVAGAGAAAVVILVAQPGLPAQLTQVDRGITPAVKAAHPDARIRPVTVLQQKAAVESITASLSGVVIAAKRQSLPTLPVPIKVLPHVVTPPALPPLPHLHL